MKTGQQTLADKCPKLWAFISESRCKAEAEGKCVARHWAKQVLAASAEAGLTWPTGSGSYLCEESGGHLNDEGVRSAFRKPNIV